MARRPHVVLVGAFVVVAVVLVVVAAGFWGSGRLFERKYRYVCYFPGSVNGLTVGAPVKYRGVPVGRVDDMLIPYEGGTDLRVAVVIDLLTRQIRRRGGEIEPKPEVIALLVQRGLRARLQSESIITGQ